MPHISRWFVDKRVLLIEYTGKIDKSELKQINSELQDYINEGETPIHILSDNSQMTGMPLDIKTLRNTFTTLNDQRWGMTCLIGANTMLRFFGELLSSSFHIDLALVKTLEDAKAKLIEHDESLAHLL